MKLQTWILVQIKAHSITFQKVVGDHVAKMYTLGAMDQNVVLLAKMPKIVVFLASPIGIFENRNFFRKNFSLGI